MANRIAPFCRWWCLSLRFYDDEHHREAIHSRPILKAGVARQIKSAGQRTVRESILHEIGHLIAHALTQISNEIAFISSITER